MDALVSGGVDWWIGKKVVENNEVKNVNRNEKRNMSTVECEKITIMR